MITITFGASSIEIKAIPIISYSSLYPAGNCWGEVRKFHGILHTKISSKNNLGRHILASSNVLTIKELVHLKDEGYEAILFPYSFCIETDKPERFPALFFVNTEQFVEFSTHEEIETIIQCDLRAYSRIERNPLTIVHHKTIDTEVIRTVFYKRYLLAKQWANLIKKTNQVPITIYCMSHEFPKHSYTLRDTTYAYKDKFIVVFDINQDGQHKLELTSHSELHEMLHILLYDAGKPPFLFLEGFPTMAMNYESKGPDWRKWISRTEIETVFSRENILSGLFENQDNRIEDTNSYLIAATFLSWLVDLLGPHPIAEAYKELSTNNDDKTNYNVFERIFGASLAVYEKKWRLEVLAIY